MKMNELLPMLFPDKDKAWSTLLEIFKISEMSEYRQEGSPAELIDALNACLQIKWIRAAGKERWQVTDDNLTEQQKQSVREAFKDLKLYDEISPTAKEYDAAFLMGALESRVRSRFDYLRQCWDNGVRFKRLYVLGGYRVLSPDQEHIAKELEPDFRNEIDMMHYIVSEEMKKGILPGVEVIYVNAPKQPSAQRATTTDNVMSWEKQYGVNGSTPNKDHKILLGSSQPYVAYQSAAAFEKLSNDYKETLTPGSSKETHATISGKYDIEGVGHGSEIGTLMVGLDCLARTVYASRKLWKLRFESVSKPLLLSTAPAAPKPVQSNNNTQVSAPKPF